MSSWKNSDMVQPLFYGGGNGNPEMSCVRGHIACLQWHLDLEKKHSLPAVVAPKYMLSSKHCVWRGVIA